MPIIYILCGLPASGKTTLSKQLATKCNTKLYHYDEFKRSLKLQENKQIHQCLYQLIVSDLLAGNNVVLDDLHTCLEWRQDLLSAIQDILCKKILVVMTTPLEECVHRNAERQNGRLPDSVIYHLHSRYQPPSLEEGWGEILYY